ncbi:MAG: hypothetical protein AAB453_03805 [Patescibacteria group bacterium]
MKPAYFILPLALISLFIGSQIGGVMISTTNLTATVTATSPSTSLGASNTQISYISNLNTQLTNQAKTYSTATNQTSLAITLRTLAIDRGNEMKKLAKTGPQGAREFLNLVLPTTTRKGLPPEAQTYVEQPATIQSSISVIIADDFVNKRSETFYSLRQNNKEINFYPTTKPNLVSRAVIRTTGLLLDNILVADTSKPANYSVITPAPPLSADSLGEQKTLVLLIDFLDSGPRPFTPAEAYDFILNPNSQFQKFYKENSYNKTWFTGDIKGWYRLNRNGGSGELGCTGGIYINSDEIQNFLVSDAINLSNYDRIIFLGAPLGNCSFVGKSLIIIGNNEYNLSQTWVFPNNYLISGNYDYALTHEVGHSLGVYHANSLECGGDISYGHCTSDEYGNSFDVMGSGVNFFNHFNAFYKKIFGWIDQNSTLLIDQPGRYTLNSLESINDGKKLGLIRLQDSSIPFSLEYRNSPNLNSGLLINKLDIINPESYKGTRLLDMTPSSINEGWEFGGRGDFRDSALLSVFEDQGLGVTIGPIINKGNDITFDVNIIPSLCVHNEPISEITTYSLQSGVTGYLGFRFDNNDTPPCGPSNFLIKMKLPHLFGGVEFSNNNTLNVGEFMSVVGQVNAPPNLITGFYPVNFEIINQTNNSSFNRERSFGVWTNTISSPHYNISVSSESGGGIVPSGVINVNSGGSQTFTITPNPGYKINQVYVNGIPVGALTSYTFSNIQSNQTINATFTVSLSPPTPSTIRITSPVTNANWLAGSSQMITWSSANIPITNQIIIQLKSSNAPTNPVNISLHKGPNDGIQVITVPAVPSGNYFVELSTSAVNGVAVPVATSSVFTITAPPPPTNPTIKVIVPTNGVRWMTTATLVYNKTVTWSTTNIPSDTPIQMRLFTEAGVEIPESQSKLRLNQGPNDGYRKINISSAVPPGKYYLELDTADVNGVNVLPSRSGVFTLISPP